MNISLCLVFGNKLLAIKFLLAFYRCVKDTVKYFKDLQMLVSNTSTFIKLQILFYVYECFRWMCVYTPPCLKSPEDCTRSPETIAVGSCNVLEIEPKFSRRTVKHFNFWAISPGPMYVHILFYKKKLFYKF